MFLRILVYLCNDVFSPHFSFNVVGYVLSSLLIFTFYNYFLRSFSSVLFFCISFNCFSYYFGLFFDVSFNVGVLCLLLSSLLPFYLFFITFYLLSFFLCPLLLTHSLTIFLSSYVPLYSCFPSQWRVFSPLFYFLLVITYTYFSS